MRNILQFFSEERVDLFKYSPVCLPIESDNFEQSEAYIYGGFKTFSLLVICFCFFLHLIINLSLLGWGNTENNAAPSDILREAKVSQL